MRREMKCPTPVLFRNNDKCVKWELSLEYSSHQNPDLSKKGDAALVKPARLLPSLHAHQPNFNSDPLSKLFSNVCCECDVYAF